MIHSEPNMNPIQKFAAINVYDASLWHLGFNTIQELETDLGILASGKEEVYGCIFGRDSLITALKLIRVYEFTNDGYFLKLVRKILQTLADLQGKEVNIESGEEPGKCIHEYRPSNHEHLTKKPTKPWFLYADNVMRNYDSIDSTALFLITAYQYLEISHDEGFIKRILPNIHSALEWHMLYGDKNKDSFIDYQLHPNRKSGGLSTQSWMDSSESVFHEDESEVAYPVAPVEVQAYAYLAYKVWGTYFSKFDNERGHVLLSKASALKANFNQSFVSGTSHFRVASAIDGNGKPLISERSSMGHCLWASWTTIEGNRDSIIHEEYVPRLVERLMDPDIFEPKAGIRTLSKKSRCFSANSYHNGSIWPHDTSIVAGGMESFGFKEEAHKIRVALLGALKHFATPIELFVYTDNTYAEYCSPHGQRACKKQAWCAASLLKEVLLQSNSQT